MNIEFEQRVRVRLPGLLNRCLIHSSLAEPKTPRKRGVGRPAKTYFRHQPHTDRKALGDLHAYVPSVHRIVVAAAGLGS
jgi:hypothetical protein